MPYLNVSASGYAADGTLTGWINPTYAYADDANYATRIGTNKNEWYGNLYSFDLSALPDNAGLISVQLMATWHNSSLDSSGPVLMLSSKYNGTVETGVTDTTGQLTTEGLWYTVTGRTVAELKSTGANGFWAVVRFRRTDNVAHEASLSWVEISINYSLSTKSSCASYLTGNNVIKSSSPAYLAGGNAQKSNLPAYTIMSSPGASGSTGSYLDGNLPPSNSSMFICQDGQHYNVENSTGDTEDLWLGLIEEDSLSIKEISSIVGGTATYRGRLSPLDEAYSNQYIYLTIGYSLGQDNSQCDLALHQGGGQDYHAGTLITSLPTLSATFHGETEFKVFWIDNNLLSGITDWSDLWVDFYIYAQENENLSFVIGYFSIWTSTEPPTAQSYQSAYVSVATPVSSTCHCYIFADEDVVRGSQSAYVHGSGNINSHYILYPVKDVVTQDVVGVPDNTNLYTNIDDLVDNANDEEYTEDVSGAGSYIFGFNDIALESGGEDALSISRPVVRAGHYFRYYLPDGATAELGTIYWGDQQELHGTSGESTGWHDTIIWVTEYPSEPLNLWLFNSNYSLYCFSSGDSGFKLSASHLIIETAPCHGYLEGQAGTPSTTSQYSYLCGSEDTQDSTSAYLNGNADTQSALYAYLVGGESVQSTTQSLAHGSVDVNTSKPACLTGKDTTLGHISAFVWGRDATKSNTVGYAKGGIGTKGSRWAFLVGTSDGTSSMPAYLDGKPSLPVYMRARRTDTVLEDFDKPDGAPPQLSGDFYNPQFIRIDSNTSANGWSEFRSQDDWYAAVYKWIYAKDIDVFVEGTTSDQWWQLALWFNVQVPFLDGTRSGFGFDFYWEESQSRLYYSLFVAREGGVGFDDVWNTYIQLSTKPLRVGIRRFGDRITAYVIQSSGDGSFVHDIRSEVIENIWDTGYIGYSAYQSPVELFGGGYVVASSQSSFVRGAENTVSSTPAYMVGGVASSHTAYLNGSNTVGTPTNYSGLVMWQKADAITGLADGEEVSTWVDSGNNNYPLSYQVGHGKPTYKTGIKNNLPIVRFLSSATQDLNANDTNAIDAWKNIGYGVLFCVFKPTSATVKGDLMFIEDGTNGVGRLGFAVSETGYTGKITAFGRRLDSDSAQFVPSSISINANQWYLVAIRVEWTNAKLRLRVNGSVVGTTDSFQTPGNTSNTSSWTVDVGSSSGSSFFSGDIGELVWYNGNLTDTEIGEIETYLNDKWLVWQNVKTNAPGYLEGTSPSAKDSKSAYLGGISEQQSTSFQAFLSGYLFTSDHIPSYVIASENLLSSISAYIKYAASTSDFVTVYLTGSSPLSITTSAYLSGKLDTNSSSTSYISGSGDLRGSIPVYAESVPGNSKVNLSSFLSGLDADKSQSVAFATGGVNTVTSIASYLSGGLGYTGSAASFLYGNDSLFDQKSAFLVGQEDVSSSLQVILLGIDSAKSSVGAHLVGKDTANSNEQSYLGGRDNLSSQIASYTLGSVVSSIHSYVSGGVPENISISGYLSGAENINDSTFGYIYPNAVSLGSAPAYLSGFTPGYSAIIAYLVGQDSTIGNVPSYTVGAIDSSISGYISGQDTDTSSKNVYLVGTGEILMPDSDININSWVNEANGSLLYPSLADADNNTYAWKETPQVGDSFEVGLSDPVGSPGDGTYLINWKLYRLTSTSGISLKCELLQGATVIASDTQFAADTIVEYSRILTPSEVANITNFADLRLRITVMEVV